MWLLTRVFIKRNQITLFCLFYLHTRNIMGLTKTGAIFMSFPLKIVNSYPKHLNLSLNVHESWHSSTNADDIWTDRLHPETCASTLWWFAPHKWSHGGGTLRGVATGPWLSEKPPTILDATAGQVDSCPHSRSCNMAHDIRSFQDYHNESKEVPPEGRPPWESVLRKVATEYSLNGLEQTPLTSSPFCSSPKL